MPGLPPIDQLYFENPSKRLGGWLAYWLNDQRTTIFNLVPGELAAPGTSIQLSLLQLVSLAQHYEHGSIMVDVSSDPEVAAWFASHHWRGDPATGSGHGVIYRFHRRVINEFLTKELLRETIAAPMIRQLGLLGLADIRYLPRELGLRPHAQAGGSMLGLENAVVYYVLSMCQGLDVFTFPLQSVHARETRYSKHDLCPPDDPALAVFSGPRDARPLSSEELTTYLDAEGFDSEGRQFLLRTYEEGLY